MNIWKLIIIEWVDAVGKTTLAKNLANFRNWIYYKTPGNMDYSEREKYDLPSVSIIERFNFYLESCKKDIEKILEIQNSGKDVICDRLLDSTIVSHKIMDKTIDTKSAEIISNSINKIQILLIAPIETIQERLSKREKLTRFEKDEKFIIKMQNEFLKRENDFVISTDKFDEKQTLELVNKFLKNYE